MDNKQYVIASYPRSGNTFMKFILCNLLYSDKEHDFISCNRHIPALESYEEVKESIDSPIFFKTHSLICSFNTIHLVRHVGDVLISEYWYKQKFHKDEKTLHEYIIDTDYGENWRNSINHYFPARFMYKYEDLKNCSKLFPFLKKLELPKFDYNQLETAINKSEFSKMRDKEEKFGFGSDKGDTSIKFVREGRIGQYFDLDKQTRDKIIEKNFKELKLLGYVNTL